MAKEARTNGNLRIAGFILTVAVLLGTMLLAWGDQKGDFREQRVKDERHEAEDAKRDADLKKDGCDIAQDTVTKVAVIESELPAIKEDIRELRVEQKADTALILRAIRDNR